MNVDVDVLVQMLVRGLIEGQWTDALKHIAQARGLDASKQHGDWQKVLLNELEFLTVHQITELGVELALRRAIPHPYGGLTDHWKAALKLFKVDFSAIAKQVAADDRAREAEKRKGKKKAAKKTGKKTPAKAKRSRAKKAPAPPVEPAGEPGVCRVCGCTDSTPCPGGCGWVEDDLCSACVDTSQTKRAKRAPAKKKTRARRARK